MLVRLDNDHVVRSEFIAKIEDSSGTALITLDDGTTTMAVSGLTVKDVYDKLAEVGATTEVVPLRFT